MTNDYFTHFIQGPSTVNIFVFLLSSKNLLYPLLWIQLMLLQCTVLLFCHTFYLFRFLCLHISWFCTVCLLSVVFASKQIVSSIMHIQLILIKRISGFNELNNVPLILQLSNSAYNWNPKFSRAVKDQASMHKIESCLEVYLSSVDAVEQIIQNMNLIPIT